jgi:hypothetical protein
MLQDLYRSIVMPSTGKRVLQSLLAIVLLWKQQLTVPGSGLGAYTSNNALHFRSKPRTLADCGDLLNAARISIISQLASAQRPRSRYWHRTYSGPGDWSSLRSQVPYTSATYLYSLTEFVQTIL